MQNLLRGVLPNWLFRYGVAPVYGALALYISAVAAFTYRVWTTVDLASSSTAAIAYPMGPFAAAMMALPLALTGFTIALLPQYIKVRNTEQLVVVVLGAVLSVAYLVWLANVVQDEWSDSQRQTRLIATIDQLASMPDTELRSFMASNEFRTNPHALAAVALNPNTGADTLDRIVAMDDLALSTRFRGKLELRGKNTRNEAVIDLIIRHPNIATDTLLRLSGSSDVYVLASVARTDKAPPEALRRIYAVRANLANPYVVDYGLSRNPNLPKDLLHNLALTSTNTDVLACLAYNPSILEADKALATKRWNELINASK